MNVTSPASLPHRLYGMWITQRYPEVPLSNSIFPILLQGTGSLVWGQELSHDAIVG